MELIAKNSSSEPLIQVSATGHYERWKKIGILQCGPSAGPLTCWNCFVRSYRTMSTILRFGPLGQTSSAISLLLGITRNNSSLSL